MIREEMASEEAIRIIKTIEINNCSVNNSVEACEEVRNRFIALDMAVKAISALDKVIAYCKQSPNAILPEDILSLIRGEDVEIETDYGYEKFEPSEREFTEEEAKRWRAKAHQIQCDKCEVGNPCLYCKHEFESQESEDKE